MLNWKLLRIADDSDAERTTEVQMDAERAIGIKIMEEINQTLFTEIMENILLKKELSSLMSAYWR